MGGAVLVDGNPTTKDEALKALRDALRGETTAAPAAEPARENQAAAKVAEMSEVQTTEKPIQVGALQFAKDQTALGEDHRQMLGQALAGIDPAQVAGVRMEVFGGKDGGPRTEARLEAIGTTVAQALGQDVRVRLIPAEDAQGWDTLTPHIYITSKEAAAAAGQGAATVREDKQDGKGLLKGVEPYITLGTRDHGSIGARFQFDRKKPFAVEASVGPIEALGRGELAIDVSAPVHLATAENFVGSGATYKFEAGPYIKIPVGKENETINTGEGDPVSFEGGVRGAARLRVDTKEVDLDIVLDASIGANSEGLTGPEFAIGVAIPLGQIKTKRSKK